MANLDIPLGEQYVGKEITLYYFNPATGTLEKQDTEKVNEQGIIRFVFEHASDYVLVVESEIVVPETGDTRLPIVLFEVVVLLLAGVLAFIFAFKSRRIVSK